MAINYSKVGWDTTKFVNPTNMNQMDNGIKAACDGVDSINSHITSKGSATQPVYFDANGEAQPITSNMDLLWTNANPISIFPPQAVSLDLSNYNFVGIVFANDPLVSSSVRAHTLFIPIGITFFASYINGSTKSTASRTGTVSNSGISFYNDYYNGDINDGHLVPYQIYGMR